MLFKPEFLTKFQNYTLRRCCVTS